VTRCLYHGLASIPKFKTIDTKAWASKLCYFNSNKLDYIAKFFGEGQKIETDFSLWRDIALKNCPKALAKMIRYNKHDVVLLERVYHHLAKVAAPKTHAGVLLGTSDKWGCPRCGSDHVKKNLTRVTAAGTVQHQMRCNRCGGNHTISNSSFQLYTEAKRT
jgi:hypothetical protein